MDGNLDKQFKADLDYLKDRAKKFKLYRNIIMGVAVVGCVLAVFYLLR